MINAGNPSAHNLQMRKYVKEHKQTSAQIFEKLNRRGRLNPAQNAMSAQLTNEQLLRFYIKDTEPKLEMSNDNIQGQGGDANSVLMSEIQRLIDVGNFNAEDAKGNMNNMQTKLVSELQRGFSSIDDSVAINLSSVRDILYGVEDSLNDYFSKSGARGVDAAAPIITALQDISTKLDQYNTTGNISQSQLLSSLTDLQNALLISNGTSTGATTNSSVFVSGNTIYADGFWQNSSRYLKNNIIPFNIDALALLNQVNIVTFNYKDDKDSVSHIGFIAEDTPIELSSPKKNAMDIPSTVGVLIKAIQQLEARIKELESKLKNELE